ncbi:unnamed protein product [Schistocephalus solidus]|uniref:Probable enoyl-CoA hydratase, mitochondrial n=1 Tax=Schistocephalus solidus TaxID=70667 RepID=A0A183THD7_SCHSO|nr:unnamed protein product [Schistocephalus solidus]
MPERWYENILINRTGQSNAVGLITLNRPETLNSLSSNLLRELASALETLKVEESIKCLVITGNERVFAAGADIGEFSDLSYADIYSRDFFAYWERLTACKKPVIAAVNGIALGGGCELAMMCDIIYAGEKAKFGQPEIKLGLIPGAGGTQRLIRAVGKSRAMEMILSGEMITAQEAAAVGLVSRVYPVNEVVDRAISLADRISRFSSLALRAAKESVNAAHNTTLSQGLEFERQSFFGCFATNDSKEGIQAFIEKREPKFTDS